MDFEDEAVGYPEHGVFVGFKMYLLEYTCINNVQTGGPKLGGW
jgi:hypothetical protein